MAHRFKIEDLDDEVLHDIEALPEELIRHLVGEARKVRANAYAPYSRYAVGAALLVNSARIGKRIFTGCNVESETFSPTICAERVAASAAIAAGAEPGSFVAVAVVAGKERPGTDDTSTPASPCGVCRQLLFELSKGHLLVVSASPGGEERKMWTIDELLPHAFSGRV
jgi:cytidine deaminase